jgi:hypothetical protein
MNAEHLVDMRNRRETSFYWGNGLNSLRPTQTVIIESARDKNGKVFLSTRHFFAQWSVFRVLHDSRGTDYVIREFAGNKWGLPFGKKYVVERKDGTRMTLDDYSSLKKGALVYLIS